MRGIIKRIGQDEFVNAMSNTYNDTNFSYDAKVALFDYLERSADESGQDIVLDTISLCAEYIEYTYDEYISEHGITKDDVSDLEDKQEIRYYIGDRAIFIEINDNSFLVSAH